MLEMQNNTFSLIYISPMDLETVKIKSCKTIFCYYFSELMFGKRKLRTKNNGQLLLISAFFLKGNKGLEKFYLKWKSMCSGFRK